MLTLFHPLKHFKINFIPYLNSQKIILLLALKIINMKKLIFAFCMILLCSSQIVMAQSKTKTKVQTTNSKESILKAMYKDISESMVKEGTPKEKAEKFADCLTKDLGAKLTTDELKMLDKLNAMKNGKEKEELAKKAEKMGIRKKMETVGVNCGSILK